MAQRTTPCPRPCCSLLIGKLFMEQHTSFKDHFSGHARHYAASRPGYPQELFDWLAGTVDQHQLAWDAATGNGQAARGLIKHFEQVVATDASAEQIAAAEPAAGITFACEPAEQSALGDQSVDLITVAVAAHWLDLNRFYAEVRRVLRPDGVVALWCYGNCVVNAQIDPVFDDFYHSLDSYWPPERTLIEAGYRTLPFPFREQSTPQFELHCDWSCDQFLAYLRSWSASQRWLADRGDDPVDSVAPALRKIWGHRKQTVRWPISLRVGSLAEKQD